MAPNVDGAETGERPDCRCSGPPLSSEHDHEPSRSLRAGLLRLDPGSGARAAPVCGDPPQPAARPAPSRRGDRRLGEGATGRPPELDGADHRAPTLLEHSRSAEPRRGWIREIVDFRGDIERRLTASLKRDSRTTLPKLYDGARRATARKLETYDEGDRAPTLPERCPYTLEQVLGDWWPDSGKPS